MYVFISVYTHTHVFAYVYMYIMIYNIFLEVDIVRTLGLLRGCTEIDDRVL